MEEIEKRLKETSQVCMDAFDVWKDGSDDPKVRETLRDAVHELRKVASRLEIEMAVRERKNNTSNAIPIPSHKSNRKTKNANGESESILPDHHDTQPKKPAVQRRSRPRRTTQKSAD